MKETFSFSFKVFQHLFGFTIALLFFTLSVMIVVLIARDMNDIEWVNKYRTEAIHQLQTPEERLELSRLKMDLKSAEYRQAMLKAKYERLVAKHNMLIAEKAEADATITRQKDRIDNAMVIEKDFSELYETRVKAKVVAAKDAVVGMYAKAISSTKDAYNKLSENE